MTGQPRTVLPRGHAKVRDLCPPVRNQEDVVAGEVSVYNLLGVEEGEGQGNVVAYVDLGVIRNCCLRLHNRPWALLLHLNDDSLLHESTSGAVQLPEWSWGSLWGC